MSTHHADPVEENIETHPVKLAIAVVVGAVGLIVGLIMLAYFAVGARKIGENDEKANARDAVSLRIAPVVQLVTDSPTKGATPVPVASAAAKAPIANAAAVPSPVPAPVAAPTTASAANGEAIYKTACIACHATGVAGAPKTGDKIAWAARIAKGKPVLNDHALKGFNAMPAKGGNPSLADADVKAAVDYLVAQVK